MKRFRAQERKGAEMKSDLESFVERAQERAQSLAPIEAGLLMRVGAAKGLPVKIAPAMLADVARFADAPKVEKDSVELVIQYVRRDYHETQLAAATGSATEEAERLRAELADCELELRRALEKIEKLGSIASTLAAEARRA